MDVRSAALLFFAFLAAASCAPAGSHGPCADMQSSSLDLNHFAKTASAKARNGSTDLARFSSSLLWMEAKDLCDPESLRKDFKTCVKKIFGVLTSYVSAVERISGFESCSEVTSTVRPVLKKLHRDMSKCVRSFVGEEVVTETSRTTAIEQWQEAFLCRYTLDRLFSFSILTARVFAVGDPARHTEGSSQRCS